MCNPKNYLSEGNDEADKPLDVAPEAGKVLADEQPSVPVALVVRCPQIALGLIKVHSHYEKHSLKSVIKTYLSV